MDAGVVFQPISFKTLLGLNEHHPYGPYCNLKDGCNPIFEKVTGIVSRVCTKSGIHIYHTLWKFFGVGQAGSRFKFSVWTYSFMPIYLEEP
jgi:hypothetical protein